MNLSPEAKTLFIPLLGKAEMSQAGLFLDDAKAEEIVASVDFDFMKLKQSKWLSMFLSLRAKIIDDLCGQYLATHQNTTVIHLGCGLDSRNLRVQQSFAKWYDVDYANVIKVRQFYQPNSKYQMLAGSVADDKWLKEIKPAESVLAVAEGLTMYLSEAEIKQLLINLKQKFGNVYLIFDAYSRRGVRLSRIKNPINQVGAKVQFGINRPADFLKLNGNLEFVATYPIQQKDNNLKGWTKFVFNHLYCGKIAQSIYRIYEFKLKSGELWKNKRLL